MQLRYLLPLVWFVAAPALAGVEGQVLYGEARSSWSYVAADGTTQTKSLTGTTYGGSLAISPIPLVPLSFGVVVNTVSFDLSKPLEQATFPNGTSGYTTTATGKITGLTYGPEIMAWAPLPFVKPYLRLGYLLGNYQETGSSSAAALTGADATKNFTNSYTAKSSSSGAEVGIGLRFSPLPLLGILVEYQRLSEEHKLSSYAQTFNGTASNVDLNTLPSSYKNQKFAAGVVRIGLQLGI